MIIDIDEETITNSPLTSSDKKWLLRYVQNYSVSDFVAISIKELMQMNKNINDLISNQLLYSVNLSEIHDGSVYFVEPNEMCGLDALKQFTDKLNKATNNKDIIWIPKVPIFTFTIRGDKNDT